MIMRALDINHDWQFGKGTESYVFGQQAIAENIQTRLLSFLNNCFFDMSAGVDWFTFFGTPGQDQQIILSTRAIILQSWGVTGVNSINLVKNRGTRSAIITYNINTIYSQNYSQELQIVNYT